jgi:hypothetical protein
LLSHFSLCYIGRTIQSSHLSEFRNWKANFKILLQPLLTPNSNTMRILVTIVFCIVNQSILEENLEGRNRNVAWGVSNTSNDLLLLHGNGWRRVGLNICRVVSRTAAHAGIWITNWWSIRPHRSPIRGCLHTHVHAIRGAVIRNDAAVASAPIAAKFFFPIARGAVGVGAAPIVVMLMLASHTVDPMVVVWLMGWSRAAAGRVVGVLVRAMVHLFGIICFGE